jgi:hypothetical protein
MASDKAEGEIAEQLGKVLAQLQGGGMKNIGSIIFTDLEYGGCHWHPSAKDDQQIATLVIDYLKSKKIW